jgi:hypothetical protein
MNGEVAHEPVASGGGGFAHGAALVAGDYTPCFYCGSRKHRAANCPSKELPYATSGLERLGLLSMDEINHLFSDYLNQSGEDLPVIPEPTSKGDKGLTFLAPSSFYELNRVFQLRFLDLVWRASLKADWTKVREGNGDELHKGTALWSAKECIRTSCLKEAEDLLRKHDRMSTFDYRVPCGFAFVEIEKERLTAAADYLNEALNHYVGRVQRSYLLLMLFRVYSLIPNLPRADEKLKDALGSDPSFHEAAFQQVIRCFEERKEKEGVKRLVNLIGTRKEYYSAALISPHLAEYYESIAPEFRNLASLTRHEVQEAVKEAERDVTALKRFVGENDSGLAQILSLQGQLSTLLDQSETLFSQHNAIDMARSITASCEDLDRARVGQARTVIEKIETLLGEAAQRSSKTRETIALFQPMSDRLSRLKDDLKIRSPLAGCLSECDEMRRELGTIDEKVRKIDARRESSQMWTLFLKDIILFSFITVAVGLVLFPGVVTLAHSLRPDSLALQGTEIRAFQEAILLIGGFVGVLLAGLHGLSRKGSPR